MGKFEFNDAKIKLEIGDKIVFINNGAEMVNKLTYLEEETKRIASISTNDAEGIILATERYRELLEYMINNDNYDLLFPVVEPDLVTSYKLCEFIVAETLEQTQQITAMQHQNVATEQVAAVPAAPRNREERRAQKRKKR